MSTTITRRKAGPAGAVIVGIAVAAIIAVTQAQARNVYACVKGDGSAHIFAKKPKCGSGESKISWSSKGQRGSEGLPGPIGLVGPTGAAGAGGSKGATGPTGTAGAKGATGNTGPTEVTRVAGAEVTVTGIVGTLSGEATATCPTGSTVVGGGASTKFEGTEYKGSVASSYPSGTSQSWIATALVTATGASGDLGVTAYVLCAK